MEGQRLNTADGHQAEIRPSVRRGPSCCQADPCILVILCPHHKGGARDKNVTEPCQAWGIAVVTFAEPAVG